MTKVRVLCLLRMRRLTLFANEHRQIPNIMLLMSQSRNYAFFCSFLPFYSRAKSNSILLYLRIKEKYFKMIYALPFQKVKRKINKTSKNHQILQSNEKRMTSCQRLWMSLRRGHPKDSKSPRPKSKLQGHTLGGGTLSFFLFCLDYFLARFFL